MICASALRPRARSMAICSRADEIEPEERDVDQLPLENDGEIGRVFEQRESLEEGFVLGGEDVAALRDVLEPAEFDPQAADLLQQPDARSTPHSRARANTPWRPSSIVGRPRIISTMRLT